MPDSAADHAVEAEVRRALAQLEASRERVYYDAEADASGREGYYAAIAVDPSPAERVYPWVDLQPDGRLRSI